MRRRSNVGKTIPWHGKLNFHENKCPHCGALDEYSDKYKTVMELSAQSYKVCIKCGGEFVDTYLIDFGESWNARENWDSSELWDDGKSCQDDIFDGLKKEGWLWFDEDEDREDSDYYNIPPQSIDFIKGEK